ncbi:MAG: ATP synthase F1 subunit epsilon [Rhodospirillales bacterium]
MADKVPFDLVTPTRVLVSDEADMVVLPGGDGDIGVLPSHSPLLTTVRPGAIDIHKGGKVTARFFIASGFAEVTPERLTILAEEAADVDELDPAVTDQRLADAKEAVEAARSDAEQVAASTELRIAEALIAITHAPG